MDLASKPPRQPRDISSRYCIARMQTADMSLRLSVGVQASLVEVEHDQEKGGGRRAVDDRSAC